MNDRLITLGGALLALWLVLAVLVPRPTPAPETASRPASQDAGAFGLLGLYRWLEQLGVPVRRLRVRMDALDTLDLPPAGNLLVTALPARLPLRHAEAAPLRRWLWRGNDVLLLLDGNPGPAAELLDALGIGLLPLTEETRSPDCGDLTPEDAEDDTVRLRPHPDGAGYAIASGVAEVRTARRAGTAPLDWTLVLHDPDRLGFFWLCDSARLRPAMWQTRAGDGRVWVLGHAAALGNRDLGLADNARLFANLAALSLGPGGGVVFDDMHQGDSVLYDPDAFFRDPRVRATALLLLGLWLMYLLGSSNRFVTPAAATPEVTPARFARTVGRFYARVLAPRDAADELLRHFHADVRRRLRRPGPGPAWDLLAALPRVTPQQIAALRAEHERVRRGRARDLRRLAALIHELGEHLK